MNKVTSLGVDFYFDNGKPKFFVIDKTFGNKEDQLIVASQNLESIINRKIIIKDNHEFDLE